MYTLPCNVTRERKPGWGGQFILPIHFTVGESEDQRERERALSEVTELINGPEQEVLPGYLTSNQIFQ